MACHVDGPHLVALQAPHGCGHRLLNLHVSYGFMFWRTDFRYSFLIICVNYYIHYFT